MSPAAVITEDLALFESRDRFDLKFIEDFAKARDDIMSLTKRQMIITTLIFVFLMSNYLAIGLDINVGGFSLRYKVVDGQFLFSLQRTVDRYNAAAHAMTVATKRVVELEEERKNLLTSQQQEWVQFVSGK